ncbi:MAG: DUF302 domain-containing protein [Desulfuromonadales bacterium]|nr:DUF302 domain-containing protein [Desulfuromonadales bacterium]
MSADIYSTETIKPLSQFLTDFARAAARFGFFIQNETKMDVGRMCWQNGTKMPEEFDLHMIQVCKPAKVGKTLLENPERAVLVPKFVIAFTKDQKTQIRLLRYSREFVASLFDDLEFSDSLANSFNDIVCIIQEAEK